MPESVFPPFSKKILLISVLFLLVNIAWYALFVFVNQNQEYRRVAPELIFSDSEGVQIKTRYDADYLSPKTGHTLVAGTTIRTQEGETAEILLENNIIRIGENTEISFTENNFSEYITYEASLPRMKFLLKKGTVWVNAFDGVEISTERTVAYFSHAVGVMNYDSSLNTITAITGTVDLLLNDQKGQKLAEFVIPLQNQVKYTDSQIIPDYALLKNSKLKKELKLTSVQKDIMENDWVEKNTKIDNNILKIEDDFIESAGEYRFKDFENRFRSLFTFNAETKREMKLERIRLTIDYLLGSAKKVNNNETERLLKKLDELTLGMQDTPEVKKLFTTAFFSVGMVNANTSLYVIKDYFLGYLFRQGGSKVLRVYLTDMMGNLQAGFSESAGKIGSEWLSKWQKNDAVLKNTYEFNLQYQMMKNIIMDYADKVTQDILNILDKAGQIQLDIYNDEEKLESDFEEKLFNITQDRLDLVYSLIDVYRYALAKQYLVMSYEPLKIDDLDTKSAAREVFIERSKLLLQRIKFGEEVMNNARQPIDEEAFRTYYQNKVRDNLILEDLQKLLEGKQETADVMESYSVNDVVTKFAESRISVASKDITQDENLIFIFDIKNARLLDRNHNNERVSFDARYDITANAVNNVMVDGKPLIGHFSLDDLVQGLIREEVKTEDQEGVDDDINDLIDPASDDLDRKRRESEDGAKYLAKEKLKENGVDIAKSEDIKILDNITLDRFHIPQAFINVNKSSIAIELDYDDSLEKGLNIVITKPVEIKISESVSLAEISKVVVATVEREQQNEVLIKKLSDKINSMKMILDKSDITVSDDFKTAEFKNLGTDGISLGISGTYNFEDQTFSKLSNPLLNSDETDLLEYVKEYAYLFVIDYLKKEQISVTRDQIQMSYPFTTINIINYSYNRRMMSFVLDIKENILKDVTLMDTGDKMESMTFDQFRTIAPTTPSKPKLPQPEPEEATLEELPVLEEEVEVEPEAETPSLPKLPVLP